MKLKDEPEPIIDYPDETPSKTTGVAARLGSTRLSGVNSDDEGEVEDVTEEYLEKRRAARKEAQDQAEQFSSDSGSSSDEVEVISEEDSDDDDDDDSYNGEDDSKEDEDDGLALHMNNNKHKNRSPKRTKDPPLHVIMEEKDLPSAPGKSNNDQEDKHYNTSNTTGELEEGSTLVQGAGRHEADQAVKDRIIKLLNTGFHEESNENEAKNAMKLAQRLMRKHNLSQAILLQERQEKNKQHQSGGPEILKGGIVNVNILNRRTDKPAIYAQWISRLVHPICKNFDVKAYSSRSRGGKTSVSFYGIYTNCQLAAYAFKVATERISQMMADYTPNYSHKRTISTKSSRLSYAIGIVKGISRDIDRNIQFEKERQERELEKKRLAAHRGEAYEESDDDDGDDDDDKDAAGFSFADGLEARPKMMAAFDPNAVSRSSDDDDDDLERANVETLFDHIDDPSLPSLERVKRDLAKKVIDVSVGNGKTYIQEQKPYWKERLPQEEFNEVWKNAEGYALDVLNASQRDGFPRSKAELEAIRRDRRLKDIEKEKQAAIVLIDHREKIADEVLIDQGIKLSKARKMSAIFFDRRSFDKGIVDSKEIDINQRAIRDDVKVKREAKRPRR